MPEHHDRPAAGPPDEEPAHRRGVRSLGELVVAIAVVGITSGLGSTGERRRGSGFLAGSVDRVAEAVVPRVIDVIDPETVLARVDLDAVLARVDLNAILDRVDVNRLLASLDVDGLLARIDLAALLDRIDFDAVMERIDIDRALAGVDVDALLNRVDIGGMMARSTQGVAETGLDLARRQLVGLDTIVIRLIDRVLRRNAADHLAGPPSLLVPREPSQ